MLLAAGLLSLLPSAQQALPVDGTRIHPQRLLIRTDPRLHARQVDTVLRAIGARELWNLPEIGWRAIEVRPGTLHATRSLLRADDAFLDVEYDRSRRLAHTPNDAFYPGMWHMTRIHANDAWDLEKGNSSVVVGIMDTGIDLTHADLAASIWTNPGELVNGIDDDGNGYIDDVHGYDFHYGDADPDDQNSHGTACAGIVAAVQDNTIGITGVAPHCKVAAIKAAQDDGYFFDSAVVPALVYCANEGFKVISMSFFCDQVTPAEKAAIAFCWRRGVLPVAAAGNDNSVLPYYPASYPETLSVGATIDPTDLRAFFSNFGTWVSVAAPGWALSTTIPTIFGEYTTGFAGTSGAAPHVAGIAALCFSAAPTATNAQVRAAIEDSSHMLEEVPFGKWTNYGLVDADAALDRVLGITTGSVPARFLFAAPCGGGGIKAAGASLGNVRSRRPELFIAGTGLETPNGVLIAQAAEMLPLTSQGRNSVTTLLPLDIGTAPSTFRIWRNGSPVKRWTWEPSKTHWYYGATDGCTPSSGADAIGTFNELYRVDGASFLCNEDPNGIVTAQFAVRKVNLPVVEEIQLEFRRDYDGLFGGPIETIEVYDWSSFSYPYGTWVVLRNAAAPNTFQNFSAILPGDPNDYRDPEGTVYVRVSATPAGPNGLMRVDQLRLRVR